MSFFARSILLSPRAVRTLLVVQKNGRHLQKAGYKRWYVETMMHFKKVRDRIGPDPPRHRSALLEWNYGAELFAFSKRLGEEWKEETLRTVFVQPSYIEQEEKRRQELGVGAPDVPMQLTPNTEFSEKGHALISNYITSYLTHCFPRYPAEGINSIREFLMSEDVLSHVSTNIGTKDLILCTDFSPEKSTLCTVLKALVGGLAKDRGVERAELFVQDFILTQLVGKDVNEMWHIPQPLEMLKSILIEQGREPPEARLIWESGRNTIEASFCVGLYSNKEFLGSSPGESVGIAEEMAARDALRRIFETVDSRDALPLGKKGRQLKLQKTVESCS